MNVRFGLRAKLLVLSLGISLVAVAIGIFSYWGQLQTQKKYEEVAQGVLDDVITIDEIYLSFKETRIALRTLGIAGISKEQSQQAEQEVLQAIASVEKNLKKLDRPNLLEGEFEKVDAIQKNWKEFKAIGAKVLKLRQDHNEESNKEIVRIFFNDCPVAAADFMLKAKALQDFLFNQQRVWVQQARATASENNKMMMIFTVVGVILGLFLSFVFSAKLAKGLREISQSLNVGSSQVTEAATQIASTAATLSQASNAQAASLEETVATIEELTAMVKANSDNSKQAASLATATRASAIKGEKEIQTLIESINSISADSKKIADITSVIDDIAFQTNLLALNAAVEAARAGEQGKGFAVVAEAVRNLAQKSAESAKSIASLINSAVGKIELGVSQAAQGGAALTEVVGAVKKVADLNEEMAIASQEQATGMIQIGKAMNQLDQVTQQNASASEQSAASAEALSTQAESLMGNITQLNSVLDGEIEEKAS